MDVVKEYKENFVASGSTESNATLVLAKAIVWAAKHIVESLDWNGKRNREE